MGFFFFFLVLFCLAFDLVKWLSFGTLEGWKQCKLFQCVLCKLWELGSYGSARMSEHMGYVCELMGICSSKIWLWIELGFDFIEEALNSAAIVVGITSLKILKSVLSMGYGFWVMEMLEIEYSLLGELENREGYFLYLFFLWFLEALRPISWFCFFYWDCYWRMQFLHDSCMIELPSKKV